MTDTYNDQTLTFLIKEIKEKVDRLEAQNNHLEKTLFKMTTNHEHMEAIIKTLMEERKQSSFLLWMKQNEKLVKWIIFGMAILISVLRVSQQSLVEVIKLFVNKI